MPYNSIIITFRRGNLRLRGSANKYVSKEGQFWLPDAVCSVMRTQYPVPLAIGMNAQFRV